MSAVLAHAGRMNASFARRFRMSALFAHPARVSALLARRARANAAALIWVRFSPGALVLHRQRFEHCQRMGEKIHLKACGLQALAICLDGVIVRT